MDGHARDVGEGGQEVAKVVTESCKAYGGFYLGSIGGPAARLAKDRITSQEVIAYPEQGIIISESIRMEFSGLFFGAETINQP